MPKDGTVTHNKLQTWDYDEFEQYLLDSAKGDGAPPDLPLRVGVTLGLTAPLLAAAKASACIASNGSVLGWSGAPASTAASAAIGSAKTTAAIASLWATAAKGIAIGLIAGGMALTAGHVAIAQSTESRNQDRSHVEHLHPLRVARDRTTQAHATRAAIVETQKGNDVVTMSDDARTPNAREIPVSPHRDALSQIGAAPRVHNGESNKVAPAPTTPAAPIVAAAESTPRTIGVASFEPTADELGTSAIPAAPKPLPKSYEDLTQEEYRLLRARTITRARAALGRNDSQTALQAIREFQKRVGPKRVGVEEILLRIEALVGVGRRKEARADAALIERLVPNSPELRRARLLAGSRDVR